MQRYFIEFIGTFLFVLAIATAVASGSVLAPLAIGCGLMAMVYFGGHISGAHYNPAVTVAVFLRGKCAAADVLPYMAAQLLGAFAAGALGHMATQKLFFAQPAAGTSVLVATVMEAVWTFALASVVLNVATHKKTAGNSYYGLAIGFVVLAGAVGIGPITGGAFNPAVGLGPTLYAKFFAGADIPAPLFLIYTLGPIAGGALAAVVFKMTARDAD